MNERQVPKTAFRNKVIYGDVAYRQVTICLIKVLLRLLDLSGSITVKHLEPTHDTVRANLYKRYN